MSNTTKPSIGFLGLGAMGFGMAAHLLKQGYSVKGFDAFPKAMERWAQAGGVSASSLEDSAKDMPFYIVMVASAPQAQGAIFGTKDGQGIAKALPQGATLLLCSTVPAAYAQSVATQLERIGRSDVHFIDAPVSGGAARAAAGTLSIMAGAKEVDLEKGKWLLQELSEKLYLVPSGLGGGSNLKMAHQVLAGIHILATSEALGLAARLGLNAEEVVKAVNGSDAWSWMFENRSPRTLREDYHPGVSALTIILKDVGIITTTAAAQSPSFPLPLIEGAEQVFLKGLAEGYASQDDAGVVRLYDSRPIASVTEPYKVNSPQTVTALDSEGKPIEGEESHPTTDTIVSYLRCVHTAAAAEAIAFAQHLSLELQQFHDLVIDAAGGSAMFKKCFAAMAAKVDSSRDNTGGAGAPLESLATLAKEMKTVILAARKVECPLWLGNQASTVIGLADRHSKGKGDASDLVRLWY